MAMRKPGKKIGLRPRVPAVGKLPGLRSVEFATDEVLEAIEKARTLARAETSKPGLTSPLPDTVYPYSYRYSYRYLGYPYIYGRGEPTTAILASPGWLLASAVGANLEREIFNDAVSRIALSNQIRDVVREYLYACASTGRTSSEFRARIKDFRSRLKRLKAGLTKLLKIIPTDGDDLTEALNRELYGSADDDDDDEDRPTDVQQIRQYLDALLDAVGHLREQEGGGGMDADRPKHQLARGLAAIFEEHTGLRAGFKFQKARDRSGDDAVCGPFADFFRAVNEKIKEISFRDRVIGFEALICPLI
jgi:hypothetical protein